MILGYDINDLDDFGNVIDHLFDMEIFFIHRWYPFDTICL